MSPFFENIYKSIETKGWVYIENELLVSDKNQKWAKNSIGGRI